MHQFRGMFAFAIWDAPKRRLLLARDRLGVKPLYWARRGDVLLFGSEIKAILASGLVDPRSQRRGTSRSSSARVTSQEPTRSSEECRSCCPVTSSSSSVVSTRLRQYWDVPLDRSVGPTGPRDVDGNRRDVVAQFRGLLEESVRLRLMSDVPLGVFLSGGIDSSAVAAIMARQIDRPLQTFSVAFEERAFNELAYAREVAEGDRRRGARGRHRRSRVL